MMPRAGGVYVFLREAYGSSIGFLYGWTLFLVIQTGTIAAVAIAFREISRSFCRSCFPDNYLAHADLVRQLRDQFVDRTTGRHCIDRVSHLDEHARARDRQNCPEHIYLCKNRRAGRRRDDRLIVRLARQFRCAKLVLVGLVGQWLESAGSAARSHSHRRIRSDAALRKIDGWPPFRPDRLDQRDVHRQRSARSGKKSRARACRWVRVVVLLYLLANVAYLAVLPFSEIQHAPQNRVAVAMMDVAFRPARRDVHGRGDPDLHVRLRQRTDSRRSARLLCHGARWVVFSKNRDHKPVSCSRGRAGGTGNLDGAPGFAAHGDTEHCDTPDELRQCLQSTARIHRVGRLALLPSDGRCINCFTIPKTGCGTAVPHVGLSTRTDRFDFALGVVDY